MSSGKEIRNQIKSVENTKKITKAMEMVAASKMRKAEERMRETRPYADKIKQVVGHVASANVEYRHPYLRNRPEIERVGYIICSTDRGLCGGLNINLFRKVIGEFKDWKDQGVEIDVVLFGSKAEQFFGRIGENIVGSASGFGDRPQLSEIIGSVKVMTDAFDEQKIQRLFIADNRFVNTMTQKANTTQLLPIEQDEDEKLAHHWDYIYEPDAREVIDQLMTRYIESLVFQSVVENVACEMAARMVAMKSASDNAEEMVEDLQLKYNKARQAAITQEISEIVSGAQAVGG